MIRALRDVLRRDRGRRLVGFVVLAAFVLVLVVGATHAGERAGTLHDHCAVCVAVTSALVSEIVVAPSVADLVELPGRVRAPDAPSLVAAAPQHQHPARAPPAAL